MKDFCRIYLTDFSQLPDLTCRQLLERLPPSRRERIDGMGAAGRAQSVAAAALLSALTWVFFRRTAVKS